MSPGAGKTWVLVAAGLMFAIIFLRRDRFPDVFKACWAAGVVTIGLSVLADLAPEIAGPAALLILMAMYWRNRGSLGSLIQASPAKAATAASPATPTTSNGGAR